MKHIISTCKFFLFAFFTSFALYCCDSCKNLDCLSDNYNGQFRIVNASNQDLVFGNNKIYDKNKFKFYALEGADTIFFNYQLISFTNTVQGYDSILLVRFYPKADVVYLQLTDTDIDTLTTAYITFDTKCCGTITEVKNFTINGKPVSKPDERGTITLKK